LESYENFSAFISLFHDRSESQLLRAQLLKRSSKSREFAIRLSIEIIERFLFSNVLKQSWTSFIFIWLDEICSTGIVRNIWIAMATLGKASSIEYVWIS
jgi:hypothetical protein